MLRKIRVFFTNFECIPHKLGLSQCVELQDLAKEESSLHLHSFGMQSSRLEEAFGFC